MNPTTFLEGTYGFIRNELTGGNEGGILVNDCVEPSRTAWPDFPLLYPNAGIVDQRLLRRTKSCRPSSRRSGTARSINLPPIFSVGQPHRRRAAEPAVSRLAEHQPDAGRRDQSLTKVAGRHTMKARLLQQPQLQGAEHRRRRLGPGFQGYVNFGNDTNNALDTGFGYANAALGVFTPVPAGLEVRSKAACSTTTPSSTCRTTGR